MSKTINSEKYAELFQGKKLDALKTALDTRKFEIEMYWKRATYFWAFIAATFAGYFALLNCDNINNFRGLTILVSSIGFFFSLGWHLVNRGSKFWQENWEKHVSMLEEDVEGPLFGCVLMPEDSIFNPKGHYPFSVSKVNQLLSSIVTAFWFILFVISTFYTFHMKAELKAFYCKYFMWIGKENFPYILILVLLICSIIFVLLSLSYLKKKSKKEADAIFYYKY